MLKTTAEPEVKIGVSGKNRKEISEELFKALADTYTLYLMTQNFHWNVTGPQFPMLHKLFEEQYQELASAIDTLAERIRALGFVVPATFSEFLERTSIEEKSAPLSGQEMIRLLLKGHEEVVGTLRSLYLYAEEAEDQATANLMAERLQDHEKTAWMLRSSLIEP